jgi:SAM-dependent methyltransferase
MRQREYWNDYAGAGWADHADALESISGPVGSSAVAVAAAAPGERVLDVGCGTGATALELGRAVGPGGHVLGLDISGPMIEVARRRPGASELTWVEFRVDDIETASLAPGYYDLAFSRTCLMLLDDPVRGAGAIHRALRPGGRLVATAFRSMAENAWLPTVLMGAATSVTGLPALPGPSDPGPFAFADPARTHAVLGAAGFVDVEVTAVDHVARPDGSPDQVAELLIELGPAGGAYRRHDDEARVAARQAVVGLLARYREPDGTFALPNATWLITARRPATEGVDGERHRGTAR